MGRGVYVGSWGSAADVEVAGSGSEVSDFAGGSGMSTISSTLDDS